jgi:hypothetical protein
VGAYLGIDLHRRRSLAVCLDGSGNRLWWKRFENSPGTLTELVLAAGPSPEVVLEATWGWYWAADVISEAGGRVHLAHPLGIRGFENRRVKNDLVDATPFGRPSAGGEPAGVVDPSWVGSGVAGVGAVSQHAVAAADRPEEPGACRVGKGGGGPGVVGDVGTGRVRIPQPDPSSRGV